MGKKKTRVLLASGLAIIMVLAMSVGAFGATGKKSLSALFKNIKLNINGKVLQTSEEPFIVNGKTYVPLRVVGEALGAWVDWNANTNVVTISGTSGTKALEDQLQQKDIQIAQLQLQIEDLQAKLNNSSSNNSSNNSSDDEDIDDLEKDLNDEYDKIEDVDVDKIDLSGDKDKVKVTVEIDADKSDEEWKDVSKSDLEDWLEDLCADIQKFYDDDTDISGKIKDEDGDTLVDFSKDGDDDVEVDIEGGNMTVDEVEKDLKKNAEYTIDGVDFEITSINYKSNDKIEVTLRATEGTSGLSTSEIKDLVEDAGKEIADAFEDDCGEDPETVIIDVEDEDGDDLGNYEYDVDSGDIV